MSTQFNFEGEIVKKPGVYSTIKSGTKNPSLGLPYGNLLIIDTGSGAGWGGGAGVNGTLVEGKDARYEFDNIEDFREFIHGGLWWLLGEPLFRPAGPTTPRVNGVSKITYVKAATTVPAEMTFAPVGDSNGSDSSPDGGTIVIQVRHEGVIGNGALNANNELYKGYGFKMSIGTNDTSKFTLDFYQGQYRGLDESGLPNDGLSSTVKKGKLIARSKEFDNIADLLTWMNTDFAFNAYFKVKSSVVTGDGGVDVYDYDTYTNYTIASGGTETFNADDLVDVLDTINDIDCDFIFADKFGSEAQHDNNFNIFTWIVEKSRLKPQMYVACGRNKNEFAQSKADAVFYDSQYVTTVHGGVGKSSRFVGTGFKEYGSYYKAASLLGREAGLAPQIPLTFKNIKIEKELHSLNDKEQDQCLDSGLLVTTLTDGSFDCLKGINSLQENTHLLNQNGTTHSKQLYRIARQINKEIYFNAKRDLLKDPNGVNRNSLSELDVQQWTKGFLTARMANPLSDNLILSFQNITVTRTADAYEIKYEFVANSEISFLFFTGLIIELN